MLDEPTANLDLVSRRGLIDTLNGLNKTGTTIIVATHDVEALPELADRVIVINHGALLGQGKTQDILQNRQLLESAGLEQPAIVRLFSELKSKGLVKHVPMTANEAQEELSNIFGRK
jgi:ABC-type multidrug transport system ATPase subunit